LAPESEGIKKHETLKKYSDIEDKGGASWHRLFYGYWGGAHSAIPALTCA